MAEPTPGRPGGAATSGTRSATAATFVVNDSSLRDLRKTWQGLTQDVKNFGSALADLKKHERDLDRLGQKVSSLAGLGQAGAGGRPSSVNAGNGRAPGMPPPPAQAGVATGDDGRAAGMPSVPHPEGHGAAPPSGGGSGSGGGGGFFSRVANNRGVQATGAFVGASSAYFTPRMGGISDSDLLYNQMGRAQGGGYNQGRRRAESRAVMEAGGFQSQEDLVAGVTTVTRALGGTATTGRSAAALQQAGQLTALNPDMGLAGSAQAVGSLYTAQTASRLQAATGSSSIGVGGVTRSPTQVYDDILRMTFRGQPHTAANINEGMVPGNPLQRNLDYLLPDSAAQEQFRAYALAKANLGGDSKKTERAVNAAAKLNQGKNNVSKADRALVKQAGLRDNIRTSQNRASEQSVENETRIGEAARGGIMQGFETLADTTEALTATFLALNKAVPVAPAAGFAASFGSPAMNALQAAGGLGGAIYAGQAIGSLFRGRRGGGGGGGGTGGTGGIGPDVQRVFVVNQCCDGVGGMGGGGGMGDGPDGPDGGGRGRGRGGRLGRIGRAAARPATAVVAGAAAWKAVDFLGDKVEDRWGEKDEDGRMGTADRLGKSAATVGKYTAGGAAAGAVLGGPVGAAIGAAGGLAVGSAKSIYDWYWGSNKGRKKKEAPKDVIEPPAPPQTYFSPFSTDNTVPRMSKGGVVGGNHTKDDVDIKATPGELIVPLNVVGRYGGAYKLMKMLGFSAEKIGGQDSGNHYAKGGEVEEKRQARELRGSNASQGSVIGDTEGLHPEFLRRLKAWSAAVGQPYKVGSGHRSLEEQQRLYDRWMRRVPGQAPAAKPGSSNHNFGLASDGPRWRSKNPGAFGLVYPMSYEPWHVEPVGAKNMRSGAVPPIDLGADPGKTQHAANGVGGAIMPSSGSLYTSELEALAGILSGSAGAAVKSQSTLRGAAAPEPGVATAAATASTSSAPANPSGAIALGQQKAAARGWTGKEWDALYTLWQKESGWRHDADNPGSSAYGIPQALIALHNMPQGYYSRKTGKGASTKGHGGDPGVQIDWGLDYIAGRYKSPSKAWAYHQRHNSYSKGALDVMQDEMAQLHAGEMVVPKGPAAKLRSMIARGQMAQGMPAPPQHGGMSSGKVVSLSITAPVTVVGKATPDDARDFLEMVKREAETETTLDFIGAG